MKRKSGRLSVRLRYLRKRVRNKAVALWKWLNSKELFSAIFDFVKNFIEMDVVSMAASTSYYMLFAFFPFMMYLLYILAVVSRQVDVSVILEQLTTILPSQLISLTTGVVRETGQSPLPAYPWLSLIILVLASAKGFGTMLGNLYSVYGRKRISSNFLLKRFTGLILTLSIGVIMLIIMFVLIIGQTFVKWLQHILDVKFFVELWQINLITYLISLIILSFMFGVMLHVSSGRKGRFRHAVFIGALMAATWIVVSIFFSNFLSGSERYRFLYGGLSGVMLLLLWIFTIITVIFTGALVHATFLKVNKKRHQQEMTLSSENSENN